MTRKTVPFEALLTVAVMLLVGASSAAAATYQPTDAAIANPERGFFQQFDNLPDEHIEYLDPGETLVRGIFRLDAYRGRDTLPGSYLDAVGARFAEARAQGVKVIVRFAYNYGSGGGDAPLDRVLGHIDQLAPVLARNTDVIALFEAGFIGAWGEWHDSTNGLIGADDDRVAGTFGFASPNAATRAITDRLIARLRASRHIAIRYPGTKRALAGTWPVSTARATSPTGRLAHTNDCLLTSGTEQGMFPSWARADLEAYLEADTALTAQVGETCTDDPPETSCANATTQLARFHYTALNGGYSRSVLRRWDDEGCLGEIDRALGYRLALTSATATVRGDRLQATLRLRNTGYAAPINDRPVELVLRGRDGGPTVRLPMDDGDGPQTWTPGDHTLTVDAPLPAAATAGTYDLSLALPDSSPSLRSDPAYAIQLADRGTWEPATGLNALDLSVRVG